MNIFKRSKVKIWKIHVYQESPVYKEMWFKLKNDLEFMKDHNYGLVEIRHTCEIALKEMKKIETVMQIKSFEEAGYF